MARRRKTRQKEVFAKNKIPAAKMVPVEKKDEELYGRMKGTVRFKGDITKAIGEKWNADNNMSCNHTDTNVF